MDPGWMTVAAFAALAASVWILMWRWEHHDYVTVVILLIASIAIVLVTSSADTGYPIDVRH